MYKVMLANLKFQGHEAVKNKDYLSAEEVYTEVFFAFHLFNLSCVFPGLVSSPRFGLGQQKTNIPIIVTGSSLVGNLNGLYSYY